jgi:hypothetical protein
LGSCHQSKVVFLLLSNYRRQSGHAVVFSAER